MCRSVDGKADTMISSEELKRIRSAEWERLEGRVIPERRHRIYSFLSVACWYFTAYEVEEPQVVDAFMEYITAVHQADTPSGSHFEQFASDHLAHLVCRYRTVIVAARENGPTDQDEQLGWKLANELSWRWVARSAIAVLGERTSCSSTRQLQIGC